jgi:hypothetical protein
MGANILIVPSEDVLTLCLDHAWFDQVAAGATSEVYVRNTDHWKRRLRARRFTAVILRRGFASEVGPSGVLVRKWGGCEVKKILHLRFGPSPVEVIAVQLSD